MEEVILCNNTLINAHKLGYKTFDIHNNIDEWVGHKKCHAKDAIYMYMYIRL